MAVSTIDALYHSGSEKLATTSTGVDVTGGVSIDDDNNFSFGDGTAYIQGSGANDRLKFVTNNSEAMRIDSSGRVGIGTSSPASAYKVTIDGDESMIRMNHTGTGSNGTLDLAVDSTIATISANYSTTAIPLRFLTGAQERMKIDSSGRVTMPYQPSFVATTVSTSTLANSASVIFNSTVTNRGNIYNTSNGRFTAPISGLYAIGAHIRVASTTNSIAYHRLSLKKNGSYIQYSRGRLHGRSSGDYSYIANYIIIELAANDYITTEVETGAGTTLQINGQDESAFYGHLVG